MGCTPSRVQPSAATGSLDATAAGPRIVVAEASHSVLAAVAENEVQPLGPTSSSLSNASEAMEASAAIERPTHQSAVSQSLRPSELSASHTQQSTPRSLAQLSPSSQRQQSLYTLQPAGTPTGMFTPSPASSAPRVSILRAPGDKKKKDWDAIRAAKQAAVSPHQQSTKTTLVVEEKEVEEDEDGAAVAAEEQKEQQTPNGGARSFVRTQSSSSQLSQRRRLTRPHSIPTTAMAQTADSPPSQSPTNDTDTATKPVKLGSAATSRQNSFRTSSNKRRKRRTSHQGMMSKLALQFPAVRASFSAVYTSFQQFCQMAASDQPAPSSTSPLPTSTPGLPVGHISVEKFPALLEHLTHHSCTFTSEHALGLFALSHIEHSPTLTFRECLIAVALGYYLSPQQPLTASTDPNFDNIARGFRVIRAAFDEIDDDSSGMLSADEMKQALFAASSGQSRDDVLQARFKELDINGDGDVEFKEFLYGVVSWVGMTSEEELDDIEQDV